jgi:hypothetical protein
VPHRGGNAVRQGRDEERAFFQANKERALKINASGRVLNGYRDEWSRLLIPEEAAPQFRDDVAPRNGMMPPTDSEMIAPPITE